MFVMENGLRETSIELPGATMSATGTAAPTAKFDLTLSMGAAGGRLGGLFEYNTDLFDAGTIDKLSRHFQNLLAAIVCTPDEQLSQLPLLEKEEVRRQLSEWNGPQADPSSASCLHELVAATVQRSPDAIAIRSGTKAITYHELNRRAEALAGYLHSRGVRCEDKVALLVDRSIETVVAILAVLKSGGAYVPLDPEYPRERLAFMLNDSRPRVLLTQAHLVEVLPEYDCQVVFIEATGAGCTTKNPGAPVTSENLAYVIYTSGSTGQPKGVCIEHRQAATLIKWGLTQYSAAELSGVLASTSFCFDLSIFELFVTLSGGGTVVLAANALALAESEEQVSLLNTVPSAMRELLRLRAVPASVAVVNLAGEALPAALVEELYRLPQVGAVYNLYGPSEDTTYSTCALMKRGAGAKVTIGRALSRKQLYVLGEGQELLAVGVTGEVCLGGMGVARGYLNGAGQTAERFVPHPYSTEPGMRLYRTGDLGRWLESGEVEFLGRRDQQVKLRGYRIELGEIETALQAHPQVREAVVLVKEDEGGEKRLLAYVVAEGEVAAAALTQYLSERLPGYMVPSQAVLVAALPLTANGKVDRQGLARMAVERQEARGETERARTAVEEVLSGVWSETLGLAEVGLSENFFALGGHSLLATQVVSRVREVFAVELPLRAIFEHPTVEGLASAIEELQLEATDDESLARILAEIKDLSDDEAAVVFMEEQPFVVGVTNEQSL
jgi:amino acid adenylation domain-containing protein